MNKTKKGFLKASAILSIIEAAFCIVLGTGLMLILPHLIDNKKSLSYFEDANYKFVENPDGSFYFEGEDEEGNYIKVSSEDLEFVIKYAKPIAIILGFVSFSFGVSKLVISIIVLNKSAKNKHSLGCTITLLVLSAVTNSLLQVAFLIAALCISDKSKKEISL